MPRNAQVLLADILTASEYLLARTRDVSLEDYRSNQDLRFIVERNFIMIGEALAVLRRHFPDACTQLEPHLSAITFRNFIVHQYWAIDNDLVWSILITKLPTLRDAVRKLLRDSAATTH